MENSQKKTVVLGASSNKFRYSHTATLWLQKNGIEVILIGIKKGDIGGIPIFTDTPQVEGVHTITLYLNPTRQEPYYNYIFSLKPKRIIFNPGTENPELVKMAREKGVKTEIACTLVMLSLETY